MLLNNNETICLQYVQWDIPHICKMFGFWQVITFIYWLYFFLGHLERSFITDGWNNATSCKDEHLGGQNKDFSTPILVNNKDFIVLQSSHIRKCT